MKIYTVGGYVRDQLMGLTPKDCDYVVVGATPQQMKELGYGQVGKDFPVFLHPDTGDEYALARTERKTGLGYGGFDFEVKNVSLEEDLFRRDLTMNAMALSTDGVLFDPYGGREDIRNGILRHVSEHFKEDPVRILRIARFSARYNFSIAPDTMIMMKEMVDNGEFDNLTGERVWKEFEKVLKEPFVINFFNQLELIGALKKIPGFNSVIDKDFFEHVHSTHYENRFMINVVHVFSNMSKKDLKSWKMPADLSQKITQFSTWKDKIGFYKELNIEDKLLFIQTNKALHHLENAKELVYAIHAYQTWKNDTSFDIHTQYESLEKDITQLKTIDYENLVKEALKNKQKPNEIVREAQISLLKQFQPNKISKKF